MFQGATFYHQHTKNTLTAFARLFADIQIARMDNTGAIQQTIAVPVAYANKDKMLRRVEADPNLGPETKVSLPRMAFEITNYSYDPSRRLSKINQLYCNDATGATRSSIYAPMPWDIEISLHIVTKSMEDGLQIVEQICPTFSPEYTLVLDAVPEMNIIHEIPVVLNKGIKIDDNAVGSYEEQRIVTHTLSFTIKTYFYGPVSTGNKIIQHVSADLVGNETYHADGTTPLAAITENWTLDF